MDFKRNPKIGFMMRNSLPPFRRRLLHGRTANFNSSEKRTLVQLVDPYKDVVDSKRNDVTTVKEKENIWNHVTRLFNAKFTDQKPREPRNLQRLWKNIKSKAKAQNTEIDAMLDSEMPIMMQPIKIEDQLDCSVGNEFHETDGQDSCGSELSTGRSISNDSQQKESEVFKSFRKIAPKPSLELPTLVQMGHGYDQREQLVTPAEHGKISVSENSVVKNEIEINCGSRLKNGNPDVGDLPETRAIADEYKPNGYDSGNNGSSHELQYEPDPLSARSGYEDNLLMMKQVEHEQKLKNLRHERELKREEHCLRMDLLKEEMELVRLRKELLKRQLDSYINAINS